MSKKIDFELLLPLMTQTVSEGGRFPLKVTGTSMEPFLHEHTDTVFIEKTKAPLKLGDIVFLISRGAPRLHRITSFEGDHFYFTGDNQIVPDGPFRPGEVIGTVYEIERNGKKRKANTRRIRFLVKLNRIKLKLGARLKALRQGNL